ncbi:alpha/beta hydrolase [Roseibium sp. SCP14]|uniref:alpha/beta hydrolase n=1 Tax=Roseibium sp. SCP14 TaxID=3141375 RepID=UPI00333C8CA6
MTENTITDWDDAYANAAYIPGAGDYASRWEEDARAFRNAWGAKELDIAYGVGEREKLDIFRPEGTAKGLVVFVHGGYWLRFDKSYWSHFAQGALTDGWAVCLPSYDLAPHVRIADITQQIGSAINLAASRVEGPVRLSGHSAGGHLVTRMVSDDSPLNADTLQRVVKVVSISGLHDLRPLCKTQMNDAFKMSEEDAASESAALMDPVGECPVVAWVGGQERPEFLRQSRLLSEVWQNASYHEDAGLHHFDVIDGLKDQKSALCSTLLQN